MERQRSAIDRQKSAVTINRQKSAVTIDRQKSAVSVRSNLSIKSPRSAQTGSSSKQTGKAPVTARTLEYPCMACESEGKIVEATNFCSDCTENLCADCVKQHQKFPAMKNHRILGKSERKKGDMTPAANPLECSLHPGKLVEMYCEDHDEIWCGACIAVHHRKCNNTMLLDKAAKGILQSDDIQYIKDNIKLVKKNLTTLKKKADSNLTKLEKQKAAVLNRIKNYRQKIDHAIDKLEQTTVKEIDQAVQRAKITTEDDKKLYTDALSTLDVVLNMVVKTKGKDTNEAAIFVGVKRAKQKMLESERVINFTKNSAMQEALRFIPDTRIMAWLKSLKQLGTFAHQQRSYSGVLMAKYNVRTKTDSASCDVFGCDILLDGRLLLTDWDNRCIKLLDSAFSVVDQCTLPGNPLDVCCINPETAVVSLTMQKMLQFVSINTTITATHTIATEENCRGIAYHEGQIFVLCGGFKTESEGHIKIFSTAGEPLSTIKTNNVNQRIFASPISIAIDADGMFYHITDGQRGVITMTPSNDVVSVVSCRDVSWPCGICMDREGNALICNGKSNTIIQISTLSKFTKVLSFEDGVKNPRAVCFDQNNLRLIVTNKGNHIAVYQLVARGMSDVAKDVKATIPTAETTDTANNTSKKDIEGATKTEDKKSSETVNERNVNKPKTEAKKVEDLAAAKKVEDKTAAKKLEDKTAAKKVEDKPTANTPNKTKEQDNDQIKTPAFSAMQKKLLTSQQTLKTMTEVTKANTSPEKRQNIEEKQETRKTPVTERKTDSALPSARQSRERTTLNRQATRQSKEDLSQTGLSKGRTSTNLTSARQQLKEGSVTSSENKSVKDSVDKSSRRPQTASTESNNKTSKPQPSDGKAMKKTPTAANSISLRSKEKEASVPKMPDMPKLANSHSPVKTETEQDSKSAKAESVGESPLNNPDDSQEATISSDNMQEKVEKNTSDVPVVETNTDNKPVTTDTLNNKTRKTVKDTLTKQNRKVNVSLQSLRSKVAPSPRPSTRDSSSTRSSRKAGTTVRKT